MTTLCLFGVLAAAVCVGKVLISALATTVFLHRSLNHECFKLSRPVQWFFRIVCWFDTGSVPSAWVAVHRKHHAHTDVEGDPHSPKIEGLWRILLLNTYYYGRAAATLDRKHWARGVPDYGWMDNTATLGMGAGILLSALVFFCLAPLFGLSVWTGLWVGALTQVAHLVTFMFINALVNGYCHVRGYKTYPDAEAFNVRWIAFLTCGEGLHNNHHAQQRNPRLRTGERPFELDLGWLVIKILDKFGQVSAKSELWPQKLGSETKQPPL